MSLITCSECGRGVSDRATSCPGCGAPTGDHAQPSPTLVVTIPKSRSVAVLLAAFLGGFGAHKFYLNRPGSGLLYALFFWTFIPAVVGFIEALYYLTLSNATFQRNYAVSSLTLSNGTSHNSTKSLRSSAAKPARLTKRDNPTSVIRDALILVVFVGVLVAIFGISDQVDPLDGEVPDVATGTTSSGGFQAERISVYVSNAAWAPHPDMGWVPVIQLNIANEGNTSAPQLDFTARFHDDTGAEVDAVFATLRDLDGFTSQDLTLWPLRPLWRDQPGEGWTFDVGVRRAGGDETTVIAGRAIGARAPAP